MNFRAILNSILLFLCCESLSAQDSLHITIPKDSLLKGAYIESLGESCELCTENLKTGPVILAKGSNRPFTGKCYEYNKMLSAQVMSYHIKNGSVQKKENWFTSGQLQSWSSNDYKKQFAWHPNGQLSKSIIVEGFVATELQYYESGKLKSKTVTTQKDYGKPKSRKFEGWYENGKSSGHARWRKGRLKKSKQFHENGKLKSKTKRRKTIFGKSREKNKTYYDKGLRKVENWSVSRTKHGGETSTTVTRIYYEKGKIKFRKEKSGINHWP